MWGAEWRGNSIAESWGAPSMEFCLEAWGWSFGWKWAFRPGLRHEDQGLLDFFFWGGARGPPG